MDKKAVEWQGIEERPSSSGDQPSFRGRPVMTLKAWDDQEQREAERLIKELRRQGKELRAINESITLAHMLDKARFEDETQALREIMNERRDVAEVALHALQGEEAKRAKIQSQLNETAAALKVYVDAEMFESIANTLGSGGKDEASMKKDRIRLGQKIAELTAQVANLEGQLESKSQEHLSALATIDGLEASCQAKQDEIEDLSGQLANSRKESQQRHEFILQLQADLQEARRASEEEASNHANQFAEQAQVLAGLRNELTVSSALIAKQEHDIGVLTESEASLQRALEAKKIAMTEAIEAKNQELSAMQNSFRMSVSGLGSRDAGDDSSENSAASNTKSVSSSVSKKVPIVSYEEHQQLQRNCQGMVRENERLTQEIASRDANLDAKNAMINSLSATIFNYETVVVVEKQDLIDKAHETIKNLNTALAQSVEMAKVALLAKDTEMASREKQFAEKLHELALVRADHEAQIKSLSEQLMATKFLVKERDLWILKLMENIRLLDDDSLQAAALAASTIADLRAQIVDLNAAHVVAMSKLNAQKNIEIADLNVRLDEWAKKVSLYEILQLKEAEYREAAEMASDELEARKRRIKQLEDVRHELHLVIEDISQRLTDCSERLACALQDSLYETLLKEERDISASLRLDVAAEQQIVRDLQTEIYAIGVARNSECREYERKAQEAEKEAEKVQYNLSSKFISDNALLNGLIKALEAQAGAAEKEAKATIASRDGTISDQTKKILALGDDLLRAKELLLAKESANLRLVAEMSEVRAKEVERRRDTTKKTLDASDHYRQLLQHQQLQPPQVSSSSSTAGAGWEELSEVGGVERGGGGGGGVVGDSPARAPRRKLQQVEEAWLKAEERGNLWERIAREIIDERKADSQSLAVELRLTADDFAPLLQEKVLASYVQALVSTQSVTREALDALRLWLDMCGLSPYAQQQALGTILMSWSGLEALADLDEGHAYLPLAEKKLALRTRLQVLFRHGHVSSVEMRVLSDLRLAFGLSVSELDEVLVSCGVSLDALAEQAAQLALDQHEYLLAHDITNALAAITTHIEGPGRGWNKEFVLHLRQLKDEMVTAARLRQERALMRSCNSQTQTLFCFATVEKADKGLDPPRRDQKQQDIVAAVFGTGGDEDQAASGSSSSANSNNIICSVCGKRHTGHEKYIEECAAAVRLDLINELARERMRRAEEKRGAGHVVSSGDGGGVGDSGGEGGEDMVSTPAVVLDRVCANLSSLELALSKCGSSSNNNNNSNSTNELDRARVVSIKMLREYILKEAQLKDELAKLKARLRLAEQDSTRCLSLAEEAAVAFGGAGGNDNSNSSSNSKTSSVLIARRFASIAHRVQESNTNIDIELSQVTELRDLEVLDLHESIKRLDEQTLLMGGKGSNYNEVLFQGPFADVRLQAQIREARSQDALLERLSHLVSSSIDPLIINDVHDDDNNNNNEQQWRPRTLVALKNIYSRCEGAMVGVEGLDRKSMLQMHVQWQGMKAFEDVYSHMTYIERGLQQQQQQEQQQQQKQALGSAKLVLPSTSSSSSSSFPSTPKTSTEGLSSSFAFSGVDKVLHVLHSKDEDVTAASGSAVRGKPGSSSSGSPWSLSSNQKIFPMSSDPITSLRYGNSSGSPQLQGGGKRSRGLSIPAGPTPEEEQEREEKKKQKEKASKENADAIKDIRAMQEGMLAQIKKIKDTAEAINNKPPPKAACVVM